MGKEDAASLTPLDKASLAPVDLETETMVVVEGDDTVK